MSVHGEYQRYLEVMLGLLGARNLVGDTALIEALTQARSEISDALSLSARRALDALPKGAPEAPPSSDPAFDEACRDLASIARIVLGQ
jgi:hypothetical protein